jgi:hypothetical protein
MLNELLKTVIWRSTTATDGGANGPVVFTSTGTKVLFTAVAPVRLLKWGFLAANVAVAQTSSAMKFTLSSLPAPGGSATAIDTLTTVASSSFALGYGGYRAGFTTSTTATTPASQVTNAGPIGNTANTTESGQQQFTLSVGQQWQIAVTTASDNTGQGILWIEYVLLPITLPSSYTLPSGDTDTSLTDNYTSFAS